MAPEPIDSFLDDEDLDILAMDDCKCDTDIIFDRSLCACGRMHYFCADCGDQADPCWVEAA